MKAVHHVTNTILTPVVSAKCNLNMDEFILKPNQTNVAGDLIDSLQSSISNNNTNNSNKEHNQSINMNSNNSHEKSSSSEMMMVTTKTVFAPNEIDQLPKRHIFEAEYKCADCSYSTKVRTNLIRHFNFHEMEKNVPGIAPVNPVPCLNKKEKMFDKMTNLAISSITGVGEIKASKCEIKGKCEKKN